MSSADVKADWLPEAAPRVLQRLRASAHECDAEALLHGPSCLPWTLGVL